MLYIWPVVRKFGERVMRRHDVRTKTICTSDFWVGPAMRYDALARAQQAAAADELGAGTAAVPPVGRALSLPSKWPTLPSL